MDEFAVDPESTDEASLEDYKRKLQSALVAAGTLNCAKSQ